MLPEEGDESRKYSPTVSVESSGREVLLNMSGKSGVIPQVILYVITVLLSYVLFLILLYNIRKRRRKRKRLRSFRNAAKSPFTKRATYRYLPLRKGYEAATHSLTQKPIPDPVEAVHIPLTKKTRTTTDDEHNRWNSRSDTKREFEIRRGRSSSRNEYDQEDTNLEISGNCSPASSYMVFGPNSGSASRASSATRHVRIHSSHGGSTSSSDDLPTKQDLPMGK